jgi:hypothetical protein
MKRWIALFGIVLLLLAALPVAAQEVTKTAVFGGGTYNSLEKAFSSSIGYGGKVGPVWVLAHGKVGQAETSFEGEVAYFLTIYKGLNCALLAGPNTDWVSQVDPDVSPLSYISGAGGGLIGWQWEKIGLWAGGKYKIGPNSFPDGWRVGAWISFNPE